MNAAGLYLPLAKNEPVIVDDHFSFTAILLDRGDCTVLVKMQDGSVREITAVGAEISPVSENGEVTIDMDRRRAVAEGIIA